MNCEKHDYHAVISESVTKEITDSDKNKTTTTTHAYELFCQWCGDKLTPAAKG